MKTQEELKQLKEEYESFSNELKELSDDELKQVTGGDDLVNGINIFKLGFKVKIPDNSSYRVYEIIEVNLKEYYCLKVDCKYYSMFDNTCIYEPKDVWTSKDSFADFYNRNINYLEILCYGE